MAAGAALNPFYKIKDAESFVTHPISYIGFLEQQAVAEKKSEGSRQNQVADFATEGRSANKLTNSSRYVNRHLKLLLF